MELGIEKAVTDFATQAQALRVVDQKSLILASDIGLAGKRLIMRIKDYFKPLKEKAKASLDEARALEQKELQKVEPIVKHVDDEAAHYLAEEKRKRLEAEAAARRAEEDRKKLEEETLRLAQEKEDTARREQEEAERKAKEAEALAAAEHDETKRKKAEEEATKIRRDMELQKRESERRAREETDRIFAEAAIQEKKLDLGPIPEKIILQGQTQRDNWSADVFDLPVFLAGVMAGTVPHAAIEPKMTWLNEQARNLHENFKLPGVRAVNNPSMMRTR
jgi:phage-related minor tail protein